MTMKPMKTKSPANNRIYFSKETEDAIIKYNKSDDSLERELIYRQYIERPFDKLAENIINTFKFPYVNSSFEDIKFQVVSFLTLNLHKFAEGKGKAFSYFSVIAKNYLILNNNNGYKHEKRSVFLSDKPDSQYVLEELIHNPHEKNDDAAEFVKLLVRYWDLNLIRIFKKKRDIDIASAVIELFRRAEGIENFNKKALYLLVREMTNYKTSYITKVVNKMRSHVLNHMIEYKETGTISMDSKFFTYKG